MKHLSQTLVLALAVILTSQVTGCNNDSHPGEGIVYYSDIVTCLLQPDSTVHFEQILRNDQGSIMLYPTPPIKAQINDGQRALLQYYISSTTPDSNHNIVAMQLSPVRHDTIISTTPDSIAAYPNNPIMLTSGWRTGQYLNLELRIEYYIKSHRLDLFYHPEQTSPDTLNVILRHDANGDITGYWTTAYASFHIPQLDNYKAMRIYANMPNESMPYILFKLK